MVLTTQESLSIITAVSGIATIVASFVAVITLLIWRKQQKYSHMLNAIMDLEDRYELLMHEYFETYKWFFQRQKLESQANGKPSDYRVKVAEKINSDYVEFKNKNKLPEIEKDYQLSYIRANRFYISLSSYETLTYSALNDFFQKNFSFINKENFETEAAIEQEMHRYAHNFHAFKEAGIEQFRAIRKSM